MISQPLYHRNWGLLRSFPNWPLDGESSFARSRRLYLRKIHKVELRTLQTSTIYNIPEPSSLDEWLGLHLPRIILEWLTQIWWDVDELRMEDWLYHHTAKNAAVLVGEVHFRDQIFTKERLAYCLGHIPVLQNASPGQDYEFDSYRVYRWNTVSVESYEYVGQKMKLPELCDQCAAKLATGVYSHVFGEHQETKTSKMEYVQVSHKEILRQTIANLYAYCRFCRVRPLYTISRGRRPMN